MKHSMQGLNERVIEEPDEALNEGLDKTADK